MRFALYRRASFWLLFLSAIASVALLPVGSAREDLDKPMYRMPEPVEQVIIQDFQPGLVEIWIKALKTDNQEQKRRAADAIRRAHVAGMDIGQEAKDLLLSQFSDASHSYKVHLALAQALDALDVREAQAAFEAEADTSRNSLAVVLEPALARWKSDKAIKLWRGRLGDPSIDRAVVIRSISRLVAAEDSEAIEPLQLIIEDRDRPFSIRLEAARAIATLAPNDNVKFIDSWLQAEDSKFDRLVAATTLAEGSDDATIQKLLTFALDPEPAVAVIACGQLASLDIELLYEQLEPLSSRRDPFLRQTAIQGLLHRRSAADTRRLLEMLADIHPSVRHEARVALEELTEVDSLNPIILDTAAEFLANLRGKDDWRCLEQTAVMVGNLDHEPTVESLFELLEFERSEVAISAAWALSRLEVPETLPRMVEFAAKIADELDAREELNMDPLREQQLTHLFQCLGITDFKPAKETLARYVPKRNFKLGTECRAAAIWALGFILKGDVDEDLAQQIATRMLDSASSPAEVLVVRRMCAVALGRMGAESQLGALRRSFAETGLGVPEGWCSAWGIQELTGEQVPPVPSYTIFVQGWFLAPLPDPPADEN